MMKSISEPTSDLDELRSSLIRECFSDKSSPSSSYLEKAVLRVRVQGESMLPALWPADVVEIRRCGRNELQIGDIAFSERGGRFFLHRMILSISGSKFVLLGDSMPSPDPSYPGDALIGRLTRRSQGGPLSTNWFLRRGPGAKISRAIGFTLCHWDFARRIVLGLHRRLQAPVPNSRIAAKALLPQSREF